MTLFGRPLAEFFLADCFRNPDAANGAGKQKILDAQSSIQKCLEGSINYYIGILSAVAALVAFVYIVYAGYIMFTAFGDEAKYALGKKTLQYAVIGFVISLSAWLIVHLFVGLLGYTGT